MGIQFPHLDNVYAEICRLKIISSSTKRSTDVANADQSRPHPNPLFYRIDSCMSLRLDGTVIVVDLESPGFPFCSIHITDMVFLG